MSHDRTNMTSFDACRKLDVLQSLDVFRAKARGWVPQDPSKTVISDHTTIPGDKTRNQTSAGTSQIRSCTRVSLGPRNTRYATWRERQQNRSTVMAMSVMTRSRIPPSSRRPVSAELTTMQKMRIGIRRDLRIVKMCQGDRRQTMRGYQIVSIIVPLDQRTCCLTQVEKVSGVSV